MFSVLFGAAVRRAVVGVVRQGGCGVDDEGCRVAAGVVFTWGGLMTAHGKSTESRFPSPITRH